MTQPTPLTEQQLDEIAGRAAHLHEYATLTDGPLQADADQLTGEDVPGLVDGLRRARDRVAELEAYAYGCDAEGCVLPHSSWCAAAKKTAAANKGCTCGKPWTGHPQPHAMHCWTVNPPRAEVEEMRKRIAELSAAMAPDTAPEATSAPLAASQPSEAPVEGETATRPPTPLLDRAEHYLSVLHTHHARHDTLAAGYGCAGCELRDAIRAQQRIEAPTPPRRTLTPNEYDAAWHAVEGAAGEEGADPGTVLHAVLNRLGIDTPAAEEATR